MSGNNGLVGMLGFITQPLMSYLWFPTMYAFIGSIGIILASWQRLDIMQDAQWKPRSMEKFDFIVVGAGSAGSVVANRLSKHYNVLLLEAGGEPNPLQFIPGFGFFLLNAPQTDWMYRTVTQTKSCLNSVNQQSSWSAGKGLGGTGNLNLMVHLRGHYKDYENWSNVTGDPSWGWEGVLPYFKSYENHEEAFDVDRQFHGFSGDLRIQTPDYVGLGIDFIKAGVEMGYPMVDLNGVYEEGFGVVRYPIKNGVRQAPFRAFLEPIRSRTSLTIRKFAHVNRVLFREGNLAYGVEYDRHGERYIAFANKEVILSAGAIGSPKILMLSGIGPKEHLDEVGIPVLQNLPVGKNLMDHAAVYINPIFINQPRAFLMERDLIPSVYMDWFGSGRGLLTSSGVHASALISTPGEKLSSIIGSESGSWPDIHLLISGVSVSNTYAADLSKAFGLKLDEMKAYYEHAIDKDSFTLIVSGARPLSRGEIKLGGSSPHDSPLINPNYLSDKDGVDVKVMIDGIKTALYMAENTTTFGELLGGRFTDQPLPGCEAMTFRSDDYWECYIRRYTVTLHHACGTASMGKASSPEAVVDTRLKVIGTKKLRVMDLSVMPVIITTNTQASALMIGEKGADMILEEWQSKKKKPVHKSKS